MKRFLTLVFHTNAIFYKNYLKQVQKWNMLNPFTANIVSFYNLIKQFTNIIPRGVTVTTFAATLN